MPAMLKTLKRCILFIALFYTVNTAWAQELEEIGDWVFITDQVKLCSMGNNSIDWENDFNGIDERQGNHYSALMEQGQMNLFRPQFEISAFNSDGVTAVGASLVDKKFDFKENETAEVLLKFDNKKTEKLTGYAVEEIISISSQYNLVRLEVDLLDRSDVLFFPVSSFLKDTVSNMKKANYVSVFVNGAYFGEISLEGFTKAYNQMEECIKHDLKDIYDPF